LTWTEKLSLPHDVNRNKNYCNKKKLKQTSASAQ